MNKGGYQNHSSGFTIIETLLVLAVTSALFMSAVVMINGRQGRTQFMTSINSLQQQLQQVMNETVSGYYPNRSNFTCNGGASPVQLNAVGAPAATAQGSNEGCIFLGKAIQFGLATSGSSQSSMGILPLVGNQFLVGGADPVLTIAQAKPRAIYPPTITSPDPDAATTEQMKNGLRIATSNGDCGPGLGGICFTNISGTKIQTGIVAFVAGDRLGNLTTSVDGGLQSGAQQISLYGVLNSTPESSKVEASKDIGNYAAAQPSGLVYAQKVSICISSATTNDSGLITIDDGLHVKLEIRTGLTC